MAIKCIERTSISDIAEVERVSREFYILTSLEHKNVIRLYEVISTNSSLYLIMEFAGGGTLDDFLNHQEQHKCTDEKMARKYFNQIISAIRYCHRKHVLHRDLKPENILLSSNHETVKIADFGLSNTISYQGRPRTPVGTPLYTAPEILFPHHYPQLFQSPPPSTLLPTTIPVPILSSPPSTVHHNNNNNNNEVNEHTNTPSTNHHSVPPSREGVVQHHTEEIGHDPSTNMVSQQPYAALHNTPVIPSTTTNNNTVAPYSSSVPTTNTNNPSSINPSTTPNVQTDDPPNSTQTTTRLPPSDTVVPPTSSPSSLPLPSSNTSTPTNTAAHANAALMQQVRRTVFSPGVADIWSCGVVLYRMIFGYLPFQAENIRQLKHAIFDTPLQIPSGVISPMLEDLLRQMLNIDPIQRISADDVAVHPWNDSGGRGSLPTLLLSSVIGTLDSTMMMDTIISGTTTVPNDNPLDNLVGTTGSRDITDSNPTGTVGNNARKLSMDNVGDDESGGGIITEITRPTSTATTASTITNEFNPNLTNNPTGVLVRLVSDSTDSAVPNHIIGGITNDTTTSFLPPTGDSSSTVATRNRRPSILHSVSTAGTTSHQTGRRASISKSISMNGQGNGNNPISIPVLPHGSPGGIGMDNTPIPNHHYHHTTIGGTESINGPTDETNTITIKSVGSTNTNVYQTYDLLPSHGTTINNEEVLAPSFTVIGSTTEGTVDSSRRNSSIIVATATSSAASILHTNTHGGGFIIPGNNNHLPVLLSTHNGPRNGPIRSSITPVSSIGQVIGAVIDEHTVDNFLATAHTVYKLTDGGIHHGEIHPTVIASNDTNHVHSHYPHTSLPHHDTPTGVHLSPLNSHVPTKGDNDSGHHEEGGHIHGSTMSAAVSAAREIVSTLHQHENGSSGTTIATVGGNIGDSSSSVLLPSSNGTASYIPLHKRTAVHLPSLSTINNDPLHHPITSIITTTTSINPPSSGTSETIQIPVTSHTSTSALTNSTNRIAPLLMRPGHILPHASSTKVSLLHAGTTEHENTADTVPTGGSITVATPNSGMKSETSSTVTSRRSSITNIINSPIDSVANMLLSPIVRVDPSSHSSTQEGHTPQQGASTPSSSLLTVPAQGKSKPHYMQGTANWRRRSNSLGQELPLLDNQSPGTSTPSNTNVSIPTGHERPTSKEKPNLLRQPSVITSTSVSSSPSSSRPNSANTKTPPIPLLTIHSRPSTSSSPLSGSTVGTTVPRSMSGNKGV